MGALAAIGIGAFAQVENAGGVRRRSDRDKKKETERPGVTDRMQGFYEQKNAHEADLSYMREIYRQLDLTKPEKASLSPE